MPSAFLSAVVRLLAPSRRLASRAALTWLVVFLGSGAVVLAFSFLAETMPRSEALPAVLGIGLSAPIGWLGARAFKR